MSSIDTFKKVAKSNKQKQKNNKDKQSTLFFYNYEYPKKRATSNFAFQPK